MATKKKSKIKFKIKLSKKRRLQLKTYGVPLLTGLLCLNIGIVGTRLFEARQNPRNIVWAADETVQIPSSLREYLEQKNVCQNYRGSTTATGVGLWGVFQVSQDKFAKIAYGCSWSLSTYILAVHENSGWKLLEPAEYFAPFKGSASTGAIPHCSVLQKYKIDKVIEPFCIAADGSARPNEI